MYFKWLYKSFEWLHNYSEYVEQWYCGMANEGMRFLNWSRSTLQEIGGVCSGLVGCVWPAGGARRLQSGATTDVALPAVGGPMSSRTAAKESGAGPTMAPNNLTTRLNAVSSTL